MAVRTLALLSNAHQCVEREFLEQERFALAEFREVDSLFDAHVELGSVSYPRWRWYWRSPKCANCRRAVWKSVAMHSKQQQLIGPGHSQRNGPKCPPGRFWTGS